MAFLDDVDWFAHPDLLPAENDYVAARSGMYGAIKDFSSAVDLLAMASRMTSDSYSEFVRDRSFRWALMAGRAAVLDVYHFGTSLRALKTHVNAAQFASLADRAAVAQAKRRFERQFPRLTDMRNVIAHAAEASSYPQEFDKHKLSPGATDQLAHSHVIAGTMLTSIVGSKFSVTSKGALISIEVNKTSLRLLYSIFSDLAPVTFSRLFPNERPYIGR